MKVLLKHLPRAHRLKRITAKSPAVSQVAPPREPSVPPVVPETPETVSPHTPDPVPPSSPTYTAVPRRGPSVVRLRLMLTPVESDPSDDEENAQVVVESPPPDEDQQIPMNFVGRRFIEPGEGGENATEPPATNGLIPPPRPRLDESSPYEIHEHTTKDVEPEDDSSDFVLNKEELADLLPQLRKREGKLENLFFASWRSALESILLNRSRSFLTVISIFIGVASVIAVLTLTQGTSQAINRTLAFTGPNTILISSYSVSSGTGSSRSLTLEDALALEKLLYVTAVSPMVTLRQEQVNSHGQQWSTNVQGVSSNFIDMLQLQVANGLWFSLLEQNGGKSVAVLGHTAAQQLFGSETNPVGQTIRVRNQSLKVIGVLAPKGGSFSQDDTIYLPFTTVLNTLERKSGLNMIQVQVDAAAHMDRVQQASSLQLLKNHAIPLGIPADFQMETSIQLLQRAQQITGIFTVLFVGIAAISLTVGGIGIMNIMLVSVAERVYEIGVRIMLGARRSDIRNQFLLEALTLCLVSSVIGLGLGLLAGLILVRSLQMPFVMSVTTFLVPFVVSAAIGIIFGLYPAMRAARLDPIGAIRSDE